MSLIKHQNRKKMKTQNNNTTTKRAYQAPKVEQVKLDNEISMVMMSFTAPPGDPNNSLNTFKDMRGSWVGMLFGSPGGAVNDIITIEISLSNLTCSTLGAWYARFVVVLLFWVFIFFLFWCLISDMYFLVHHYFFHFSFHWCLNTYEVNTCSVA